MSLELYLRSLITTTTLYIFFATAFLVSAYGQEHVLEATNTEYLLDRSVEWEREFNEQKAEALFRAMEEGWPVRVETEDGGVMELMRIDDLGNPVYYTTTNSDAAVTSGTNELYSGGSLGLDLDGTGMTIGEWDGGGVRLSHQEFGSRVTQVDNPSSYSDHATHVAGTLIGGGVVNSARGMSYAANLLAHTWNNDNSEMATAAANGLLISNHSYGTITGWRFGNWANNLDWRWYGYYNHTEDYKFGWYNAKASNWDEIAYNAPYYLIVKSAGNNRSSNGPGTGDYWTRDLSWNWVIDNSYRSPNDSFNTIPTYGNAKNIMTVGAVQQISGGYSEPQDVVITGFSSWGPTDDGRIKPDIVAQGSGLYSASSSGDADYSTKSGTSMSAPATAGSLLLLQEHYHDIHNVFMQASTLKGLAIHTAHEAGHGPGPDYIHGWGLLNTEGAAEVISNYQVNHLIQEQTLIDQNEFTQDIYVSGDEDLIITLCWTDPEANSTGGTFDNRLNNTTSKLIHDLDVRVSKNNNEWEPFVLDPSNPAAPATTGDNDLDNVEKILVENPDPGTYTIAVSHKGNLTEPQDFSLIVSGISKALTTQDPDKSSYCAGDSITIEYTAHQSFDYSNTFTAQLSGPGGNFDTPYVLDSIQDSVSGKINTKLPDTLTAGSNYAVRVVASDPPMIASPSNNNLDVLGELDLPVAQSFSDTAFPPANWRLENPDNSNTWVRTTTASGYGASDACAAINNYDYNSPGELDYLHTGVMDFSGDTYPTLEFDVAYAPYSTTYSDTLEVRYSTDCGSTYTQVFRKGGGELATAPSTTSFFSPDPSEWRTESINLHALNGYDNVEIAFVNQNGYGNALYIDNISVVKSAVETHAIDADTLCEGYAISVPFTVTGHFEPNNTFIAELSDTSGSFSDPVSLDSLQGDTGDTIHTMVPSDVYDGNGYRIRVRATQPAVNGSDNGLDLTLFPVPEASINQQDTTVCEGASVSLNANDGDHLTYQWLLNHDTISSANLKSYDATDEGDYAVRTAYKNTCINTSATFHLETIDAPDATVTTSGDVTFCEGDSVTFNATEEPGYNWQWMENGNAISGAEQSEYTAHTSGDYFAEVTDSNGCVSHSDTFNVTVNDLPEAEITQPGDTSVCESTLLTFTANQDNNLTYQWTLNGDSLSGAEQYEYDAAQPGAYAVHVSDQNGCKNVSEETELMHHDLPDSEVVASGDLEFCEGDSVTFSAAEASGYNWQWMENGNAISGAEQSDYTAHTSGEYFAEVTDSNGCVSYTDTFNVTVNDLPEAEITQPGDTSVCESTLLTFTANQDNNLAYQWTLDGDTLQNAVQYEYDAVQPGAYAVEIKHQNGCVNVSDEVRLTYHDLPVTTVEVAGDTEFCEGDTVTFSAPDIDGYTYQWHRGSEVLEGADSSILRASESGDYMLVVEDSNACIDTSAALPVEVNPLPDRPEIIRTGNTLIAIHDTDNPQWYDESGPVEDATSDTFVPEINGDYYVGVSNVYGCESFSDTTTFVFTNLADAEGRINARVYPNPSDGTFNLEFDQQLVREDLIIEVFNTLGKSVFSKVIAVGPATQKHTLKLHDQDAGVYVLRITSDGITEKFRLVLTD